MDASQRAQVRREQWQGGIVGPGEQSRLEATFWAEASAEGRLAAIWELAEQAWRMEHPDGPPLRLDRSIGGIRPRGR